MRRVWWCASLAFAASLAGAFTPAEEPAPGEAVVADVDGKESKITNLKFTTGTKRLAWLADPKGTTEDEKKGPLAFQLREATSALPLAQGVITLVPTASLESVRFDYEKQLVSLNLKGLKNPLTGTLAFAKINALGFGGSSGGKAATFTGGVLSGTAVKTATFSGAVALPNRKAEGIIWNIQIVQTKADLPKVDNPTLTARNLKVLYSFPDGSERLLDGIPVRKGAPVPFDEKLKRFEILANDLSTNVAAAEVEVGGGPERVIIIPATVEQDKKTGTLVGILGEVDTGWKLFPLHTIKVIKPSMKKVD